MYRANFYGQSDIINRYSTIPFKAADSSLKFQNNYFYMNKWGDGFSKRQPCSFEERLKSEIDALKAAENAFKNEQARADAKDPLGKQEIKERSSMLNAWKNFLTMVVDQAQKTMQNISANFR